MDEQVAELGKQLAEGAKGQPVQIKQPPILDEKSRTVSIANRICANQGHVLQHALGRIFRPQPSQDNPNAFKITEETIIFCSRCGASLQEIKGQ